MPYPGDHRRPSRQIHRTEALGQIIGHADGNRSAAIIDRDQCTDAASQLLLRLIDQSAQFLGIEPLNHLSGKGDIANRFRFDRLRAAAIAGQCQSFFRFGQFTLQLLAFLDQHRDPLSGFFGRRLERCRDRLQLGIAIGQPETGGFSGQRFNPSDTAGHRRFTNNHHQPDIAQRMDIGTAA